MNQIKQFREAADMTIRKLSEKASVAVGYLSTLENDTNGDTNPSKDVMQRISEALGKTVSEVFFPEEIPDEREVE
jgi:transcriptional regulator with XRE-family HTH domain